MKTYQLFTNSGTTYWAIFILHFAITKPSIQKYSYILLKDFMIQNTLKNNTKSFYDLYKCILQVSLPILLTLIYTSSSKDVHKVLHKVFKVTRNRYYNKIYFPPICNPK